jgi:hypothetical protein
LCAGYVFRSGDDSWVVFGSLPTFTSSVGDCGHFARMLMVVRECPVDIGDSNIEAVRGCLRFEIASFDELVDPVNADTGPVDTRVPAEDIRCRDDVRALLRHLVVR